MNRKEYINEKCPFEDFNGLEGRKWSHERHVAYYMQFAKASANGPTLGGFTKKLSEFQKLSGNLSEIPLEHWDRLGNFAQSLFDARKLTDSEYTGTPKGTVYYSRSDIVCIAKCIVRDYLLKNGYVEKWELNEFGNYENFLYKDTME